MPRNVAPGQPAGEQAWRETAHMDGEADQQRKGKAAPPPQSDPPRDDDGLPEWIKGNDLFALRSQTPGVLIGGESGEEDGALLRQRRKMVIGGSSKMGKTWTLCDLALAVASGGRWLGKFSCHKGVVLYVNLELDGSTAGRRMEWIASCRGIAEDGQLPGDVHENLLTWNLRGKCYDLSIMLSAARQRIKDVPGGLRLIILDPIYKTYGGRDENAAGDMAALMLELEQFADECGAAIAFAAHFSKGNQSGKEAIDRISGSGVIARDPDAILTFTSHEEENCFVLDANLREFAPVRPTVFEWTCPVLMPRDDLDPARLRQPGKVAVSKAPDRAAAVRKVLDTYGPEMESRSALVAAIKADKKFPDNSIIAAWRKCLKDHPSALEEAGVDVVPVANGKDPIWRVKQP
jgi:hypothetical protein